MKTYMLTFPNGLQIDGFKWSILGYFYLDFPCTGVHSAQSQSLKFTPVACEAAGVEVQLNEAI